LQSKQQDISSLWKHIAACKTELKLWEQQVREKHYAHFKTLLACEYEVNSEQYASIIYDFLTTFARRFLEVERAEQEIRIFVDPFSIEPNTTPTNLQMKLIDSHTN